MKQTPCFLSSVTGFIKYKTEIMFCKIKKRKRKDFSAFLPSCDQTAPEHSPWTADNEMTKNERNFPDVIGDPMSGGFFRLCFELAHTLKGDRKQQQTQTSVKCRCKLLMLVKKQHCQKNAVYRFQIVA